MTVIRFTHGSYTFALTGPWVVLDFSLPTPEVKGSDTDDPTTSGGERYHATWRNVTQVIEVMYIGDRDTFFTQISTLENVFNRATERQSNAGVPRVFIERQILPSGDWYRSEVLFARIDYDPALLHFPWPRKPIRFFIGIRRRYFWEDVTLRQIPLATTGVAKTFNEVSLWNHTDAGQTNFVDIDAADVVGTMPSPVTIKLINKDTSGQTWLRGIYIATNVNANPRVFSHVIEAENINQGTLVPGSDDLTNYSNGRGREIMIYPSGTLVSLPDLSTALLEAANFQYFHLLMRLTSSVNANWGMWSQVRLTLYGLTVLWQGDKVFWQDGSMFRDLGVIQIPPWLSNAPRSGPLRLQIMFGHGLGSPVPYTFDFFELLASDNWMYIEQAGYYIELNDEVTYDGELDRVYVYDPGDNIAAGIYTKFGGPVVVRPGLDQRFYFHHLILDSAPLGTAFAVKIYYRPRRLSL